MSFWTWLIIICSSILLISAGVLTVLSYALCSAVIRPPKRSHETALHYHISSQDLPPEYYGSLNRIPWSIVNTRGFRLFGEWILPPEIPVAERFSAGSDNRKATADKRMVIIVHGHGHNRMGALKYLPVFLKRGYRVLIYDQMYSGESEGRYSTLGYVEAKDLRKIVDQLFQTEGNSLKLGLVGESMGAATVLMEAADDPRISFVVSDCAFADLTDQLCYRLSFAYRLSCFPIMPLSSLIARWRAGFHWSDVSPVQAMQQADNMEIIPVLFAHGLEDTYIPPDASRRLYSEKKGYKDLLLIPDARHADAIVRAPDLYEQAISRLLEASQF